MEMLLGTLLVAGLFIWWVDSLIRSYLKGIDRRGPEDE